MMGKENGHREITADDGTAAVEEKAVRAVPEPDHGRVTSADVETLREDPELAEIAELAEQYV